MKGQKRKFVQLSWRVKKWILFQPQVAKRYSPCWWLNSLFQTSKASDDLLQLGNPFADMFSQPAVSTAAPATAAASFANCAPPSNNIWMTNGKCFNFKLDFLLFISYWIAIMLVILSHFLIFSVINITIALCFYQCYFIFLSPAWFWSVDRYFMPISICQYCS